MGTESAVTYACIYMGNFDEIIKEYAKDKDGSSFIHVILRFIDDGFLLLTGTKQQFETFLKKLNKCHESIKFTASYNFDTKSVTFLDTQVTIVNNQIQTD